MLPLELQFRQPTKIRRVKKKLMKFLILHGPNLNLLGTREPEIYGSKTLEEVNESLREIAQESGHELRIAQSNVEGELVTLLQEAGTDCSGILFNPAAYTHTSVAIRDAISGIATPTVEVHLSVPDAREDFRQVNLMSDVVVGRVEGFGHASYAVGLRALMDYICRIP